LLLRGGKYGNLELNVSPSKLDGSLANLKGVLDLVLSLFVRASRHRESSIGERNISHTLVTILVLHGSTLLSKNA